MTPNMSYSSCSVFHNLSYQLILIEGQRHVGDLIKCTLQGCSMCNFQNVWVLGAELDA